MPCEMSYLIRTALLVLFTAQLAHAAAPRTFCNPIDIDYGLRVRSGAVHRHGADPVIVLFNDRYYLFSTWDRPGYRVSDDLLNWKYIPFDKEVELLGYDNTYTAAAVMIMDGWLYYTELAPRQQTVGLYRTRDPDSGKWEKVRSGLGYKDPCLFLDPPSGRVFMYDGLESPIRGVELDRTTFEEVPDTKTQLMPAIDPKARLKDGWEVCTWDNSEASKPMRGNKTFQPCREGSWMTLLNGKYYLQFASPGTTVPGYCDGYLTGDSPLGPFTMSPFGPVARKDSGFITSAGHGCLFQDRHGNWWRAVTMLIGVHERMERRIGLFPAGFDTDGVPYTRTELGDLPITLADGPRDHLDDGVYAGWFVLSRGKAVSASSSVDDRPPELANDEDIRTTWSAKTGDTGEWLQIDLGGMREVRAAQINLDEQAAGPIAGFSPDQHRFVLSASDDDKSWRPIVDRSQSSSPTPNAYVQFAEPVKARYFKLENVFTPGGGKFAVSDLRLFGISDGPTPESVTELTATRDATDRRKVTLSWKPAKGATAYLIRYGIEPAKLYQHHLVNSGDATSVTLYCLNNDRPFTFVVDAMNDAGRTAGTVGAETP